MIGQKIKRVMKKRHWRHILFWLSWILGFTFIKSFGQGYDVYLDWLGYYILSLPIFVSHTYLVVYYLIPRFFTARLWPLFMLLFLLAFYGFSCLELVLSYEFIYRIFAFNLDKVRSYLETTNVIRNGVGNLYVVLVFLAVRTIIEWDRTEEKRKIVSRQALEQEIEETMIRVQPLMLLYSIDHIDELISRHDPRCTQAIAMTSELLSEVMMFYEEGYRLITREIELVKKLLELVSLFRGKSPEVEFFISGDPGSMDLPPMILFSFFDMVIREYDDLENLPEINVEASGFSNMLNIQILQDGERGHEIDLNGCLEAARKLEKNHCGEVNIPIEYNSYGCFVVIMKAPDGEINALHSMDDAIGTLEDAGD